MSEQPAQYQNAVTNTRDIISKVYTLLEALRDQRSIDSLKTLFWSELNYNRANVTLSRRQWSDDTANLLIDDPLLLATGGDDEDFFVIYSRLSSDRLPFGDERRIVNRLLNSYQDGLFIFSNRARDTWHFLNVKADVTHTKRRLLRRITIGPDERLHTASERIALLDLASLTRASRFDILERHEEAFDVEAVTSKFYQDYKNLFRILQIDLTKQTDDETWAHDYSLQFLNRCMFLYFIQRKGWLGNDRNFLRSFWQSYIESAHEKDTFFKAWLQVLFFAAFNNSFRGLFSPNKIDRVEFAFVISDTRFLQVFEFLERYNFTIVEDSPLDQEVAVDPEMIGRVYENLVNVSTELDERGDAGIFYTPRTEIDLMCRLSLVDYLANHIGQEKKPFLFDVVFALDPEEQSDADIALNVLGLWNQVHGLLREVTVLDPACGSGAFLVGMLYVLDNLQDRVSRYIDTPQEDGYTRKKRIIGKNLYGVDIMEWAAHVAELRLWLTLIVDADFSLEQLHMRRDPLLPHLTFKVRYGDSLVQEFGGLNFGHRQATSSISAMMRRRLNTLKDEKIKFYYHDSSCIFNTREEAIQEEINLFRDIILERQQVVERAIHDIRKGPAARQIGLPQMAPISASPIEERERQRQLAEREHEKAELERVLDDLAASNQVPFVWDIAFVEVLESENDGFDIVIGNPPYVRQEQISNPKLSRREVTTENKRDYKRKLVLTVYQDFPNFFLYNKAKGTASRAIDAKSDLYIYFYLHGLWLLNSRGSFCFITSNSWLDVGYGTDLQEFLLRYCRIQLIIDNQVKRSFATADVNTIIALFSAPIEKSGQDTLNHIARFVMFKVGFEHVLDTNVFKELQEARERTDVPQLYRVYPIAQATLLQEGMTQPDEEREESIDDATRKRTKKGKVATVTLNKEALVSYGGNKWGGKYLRAPEIYWTIMENGKDKLEPLGKITDVRRGITTGANEFFYLDEAKIMQWGIEPEFLQPIIKSPTECVNILIHPQNLKFRIFICSQSKKELEGSAALEYINWGESASFRSNPSLAGRTQWWSLHIDTGNSLFVKEAHNTSAVFYNLHGYPVDCRLYYANLSKATLLYLNSIIGAMLFEIYNRAGLGGGARSLMVSDYIQIPVLGAIKENEDNMERILQSIYPLFPRKLTDNIENQEKEWLNLDTLIFDVLNLTQGERDAVYEAVIKMAKSRLEKAQSLRASQGQRKRMEAIEQTLGIWIGLPEVEEEVDNSYV